MIRSQWRREQRRRKAQREAEEKEFESNTNVPSRKKEEKEISLIKGKFNTPAEAAKEKNDRMVA